MGRRGAPQEPANDPIGAIGAALDDPADAPHFANDGDQRPFGGRDEDDELDAPFLPADCPVKPLGMTGQICWYLDVQGQLIPLAPRDHSKNSILLLFTPKVSLPERYWPQWSAPQFEGRGANRKLVKESEIIGFDQADAAQALIGACGLAGIFDAHGKVRGRGAHSAPGGTLVLHAGDQVMLAKPRLNGGAGKPQWYQPSVIDGFVYTAGAPLPKPHSEPVDEEPGERLLKLLSTWRWRRPVLDPMLKLGWIAQGYIGGALDWRSHLFITGGAGTGKSTLNGKNGVVDRLYDGGALRTGNASEAAVRQMLVAQTIPVIFDEFEPSEFNAGKIASVVELARVASSGADFHRGSSDHKAQQFTLRSPFQFSAILMPEMEPQDRSRFAILELEPFPEGTAPVDLDKLKLPELGRKLARRMVDGWPRFAETLRCYKAALALAGNSPRACDQFGTLLACADLLLYDHAMPAPELLDQWAGYCSPAQLSEIADASAEQDRCLTRLATAPVQLRGGDPREPLAKWIDRAWREGHHEDGRHRREHLQYHGLKLVAVRELGDGKFGAIETQGGQPIKNPPYLAVANGHQALDAIFGGSKWQRGAWAQALGRVPGAVRGVKVKFAGRALNAVCVPIEAVISTTDGEEAADA